MAGIPYWTFDIGAFVIGSYEGVFSNGGKDPAYQEFYTRMFQFGTFCPIFRAHGSETPREIWEFGEFSDVLVKFDNLRYRLLPYIYSLAWRVTNDGYTIMRGLPMDFARDKKTYSIDDQFMFGPAIMVCPVTEYMLHRPPEDSILITPEHFKTKDGKPGLIARYYNDAEFKTLCHEQVEPNINLFWYTGWPDYITDPTFSVRWEGKLIPTQTGQHRFHMKSFGPKRVFLDGKELPCNYWSVEFYTVPVELKAGKEYDFAFETSNSAQALSGPSSSGRLRKFTPEKKSSSKDRKPELFICPPKINGSTFGPARHFRAAKRLPPMPQSIRFRCWSSQAPSFRWVRSFNMPPKNRPIPLNCAFIPALMEVSRCMKTRTTITIMKRASIQRLLFTGMTQNASSRSMPEKDRFPAC